MAPTLSEEFLTTVTRAIGVLLVAGLMLPLSRVLNGSYLRFWAIGWASLAIGLLSAYASSRLPDYRTPFLIVYCLSEFGFAWLLWLGCNEACRIRRLRWIRILAIVLTAGFAIIGPSFFPNSNLFFSLQSGLLSGLFLLSLGATSRMPRHDHTPSVGVWVLRSALAGLFVLYAIQALVGRGGHATFVRPEYLGQAEPLEGLPGELIEVMLAFGMVLLATDRMREQLQSANVKLQAAADELRVAAQMDGLTGLLNRSGFETMLAGRDDAPISGCIAVLDLNNLKPLNDQYGHAAGDTALKLVARALRTHFRVTDPLFRIGGDEFAVVMMDCDACDLSNRLRKIDDSLLNQRLPRIAEPQDIVVAWGVAEFQSPTELAAAFQKADASMYERKRLLKSPVQSDSDRNDLATSSAN